MNQKLKKMTATILGIACTMHGMTMIPNHNTISANAPLCVQTLPDGAWNI